MATGRCASGATGCVDSTRTTGRARGKAAAPNRRSRRQRAWPRSCRRLGTQVEMHPSLADAARTLGDPLEGTDHDAMRESTTYIRGTEIAGKDVEGTAKHERIPEGNGEDPGAEEERDGTESGRNTGSRHPLYVVSQHTACVHKGLAGCSAPSTPGRRDGATPRRFWASPASEAHGRPPPSTRWRGSSACASALRVTAATDRAGLLLRASRKGWPAIHDERSAACRGPTNECGRAVAVFDHGERRQDASSTLVPLRARN